MKLKLHVEGLVDDIRGQIAHMEETPTEEQFRHWFVARRVGSVGLSPASPR
jgi:hypothetical protein